MRRTILLLVTLAILASPASAALNPDLVLTAGRTLAVSGEPNEGGLALAASAMWDLAPPIRAGVILHADDLGTLMGRLYDERTGEDLGAVEVLHRMTWGAGWRFDAELPDLGTWKPFVSGTFGVYRVADDVRGDPLAATTSTGLGVGAGVRRTMAGFGALGVSARWNALQSGPVSGWLSLGLDWQVRLGKRS
jgi:hypothetical protein